MHRNRIHRFWLTALLTTVLVAQTRGQEFYVLPLKGEGTATIAISRDIGRAYITDGGRSGSADLSGVRVQGQNTLVFLVLQKVSELVVTCSHPHSDHIGGLVDAVQDRRNRRASSFCQPGQ